MVTVTRKFSWDAAHRVLGHAGKCRHLHGHTWFAEVEVAGSALDRQGMVVDFSVLKELVGGWIDDNWDHNIILAEDDPQLLHLTQTEERPPFAFPDNPTSEHLAGFLATRAQELLNDKYNGLRVVRVRIWETPGCSAEVIP